MSFGQVFLHSVDGAVVVDVIAKSWGIKEVNLASNSVRLDLEFTNLHDLYSLDSKCSKLCADYLIFAIVLEEGSQERCLSASRLSDNHHVQADRNQLSNLCQSYLLCSSHWKLMIELCCLESGQKYCAGQILVVESEASKNEVT